MRSIFNTRMMWSSKWTSNFMVIIILLLMALLLYSQHRMVALEEQQKLISAKITRISGHSPGGGGNNDEIIGNNLHLAYEQPDSVSSPYETPDSTVIIYNRIPKTGSTSLMGIAYELCSQNSFHVIHLNTTKNSHVLNPMDQFRFAQNISAWFEKRPAIYHGHIGYLDFTTFSIPLKPIYINLVRDPLDRLVSYYYFLRFGDNFRPEVQRKKKGNKETFDECVARQGADCDPVNLWMQIPFFCGHHVQCWDPGNSWALQQAKSNLARYFLVGITENMDDFVKLLEASLPRFFRGAFSLFETGGKSHLRQTFGKQAPSKETVKFFKKSKIWQMEQDFYMFAKKNFNAVRKRTLTGNEGDSDSKPIPQQFRFEKIRPK